MRAWEARGSAIDLPGAGGPRAVQQGITSDQMTAIADAAAELPGAIIEQVVERALEIGRERGVAMPTLGAMTKHAAVALEGRLPDASPASGADLVVEHCVVDLPVGDPDGTVGTMPFATVATAVAEARILGLSVAPEAPTAAGTAAAIAEAVRRTGTAASARPLAIYLNGLQGEDWDALRRALDLPGVRLVGRTGNAVSPPAATIRLVGRRVAGVRIMARLGRRPAAARRAVIEGGGRPLEALEAERLLRARWAPASGELAHLAIDEWLRSALISAMERLTS